MKKVISFLLLFLFAISCETTQEPKKETQFKLIGSINFTLNRIAANGQFTGSFNCGYYLSKSKIELLSNNNVIETVYPKNDTLCDAIYVLENVEFNTPYKIRITLNDEFTDSTEEFSIGKTDVKHFPYDSATTDLTGKLSWFEEGDYYSDLLFDSGNNISFNLYTNDSILNVFPNPIISEGDLEYFLANEENVEISVNNIDKSFYYIEYRGMTLPGRYNIQFGDDLADGLYFVKMICVGKTLYCPFLKGRKGAPAMN